MDLRRLGEGRALRLARAAAAALVAAVFLRGARAGDGGLVIESPANGAVVGASVRVAGRVPRLPPGREAVLRVNGADVEARDGRFETTVVAAADGPLRLRAAYSEPGDPAQVVEVGVVVDSTAPTITIDEPATEESDVAAAEATVRGVARDPHLARVRLNENDVSFDRDGAFDALFLLPASVPLEVTVEAIDSVGNRSTARRMIRRAVPGAKAEPSKPPLPPAALSPSRAAVEDALRWLAAHQSPHGGWEAEGFGQWCDGKPTGAPDPADAGKAAHDVGVTGLALLAFLRAGYTGRSDGPFGRTVAAGLRRLKEVQDAEGCFGSRTSGHYVYGHAVAATAMIEAFAAARDSALLGSASRGLAFVAAARNPAAGWRYGVQVGDSDTSVTGWMAGAILAARDANEHDRRGERPPSLAVDAAAVAGAARWVDAMTDPETGRVGYQARGMGPARPTERIDQFPAERSEAMTAAGLLVRALAGEDLRTSAAGRRGCALVASRPPTWDATGSIDFYYWYLGSRALAVAGSPALAAWRTRLHSAALPRQRRDGDACGLKGSWDPVDVWGPDGGRVYSTAIVAMALEAAEPTAAAPPGSPPAAPTPVKAADPAPTAKERRRALIDRAARWALLREGCLSTCETCDGQGALRGGAACPRCRGKGKVFNSKLQEAFLGFRSPAYRGRSAASTEFAAWYERVLSGAEGSPVLRSWRLDAVTLADDDHAVAPLYENGATVPTQTRWVWSSEPAFPKGTWFLWTESSDGRWP